jgi:hypothetical protein
MATDWRIVWTQRGTPVIKWTQFPGLHDALFEEGGIGSIQKCQSTLGSDAFVSRVVVAESGSCS